MLRVLLTFCLLFAISPDDSFSKRKTGNIGNKKFGKPVYGGFKPWRPGGNKKDDEVTGQPVGDNCRLAGCSRTSAGQPGVQAVNGLDKCVQGGQEVGVVNCNHHGGGAPIRDSGNQVPGGASLADICCI